MRGRSVPAHSLNEKEWMRVILDYARLRNWLTYHTFDSRRSTAGFPDIVAVRGERLVMIEAKSERGKVSPAQEEWLSALREAGITARVARPSDWPAIEALLL